MTFFPFSALVPDGGHYGRQLDRAINVLPIHGGYRSLRQKAQVVSTKNGPMTGCFIHIYQQSIAEQVARPNGDDTPGIWLPNDGTTLYTQVDEENPADGDFIYASGAPSSEACKLALTDLAAPAVGAHTLKWRYKIGDYSPAAAAAATSITRVGATATATTAAPHGLTTGDYAFHIGATQPEYNGAFQVTVTGASTYTFTVTGAPATPATGTITWKRAWWVRLDLVEGATVRATDTAAGGADEGYTQRSTNIGTPAIGTYSNTFFVFTAYVPGVAAYLRPASDDTVGAWTTQAGGTSGLFGVIDETAADDADYVHSPALAPAGSAAYVTALGTSAQFWVAKTHTVRYRYYAENAGMTLTVKLLQGTTEIASWSHTAITAGAWTAGSQTLSAGERTAIQALGYTGLKLSFAASYPAAVTSTATQTARPTSDVDNTDGWLNSASGSTDLYRDIDDTVADDNVTAIVSNAALGGAVDVSYTTGLGALVDPLTSASHVLSFRWRRHSTSAATLAVYLYQGATLIATVPPVTKSSLDNTWSTVTYTLTASEADSITDYSQLRIKWTQPGAFVATETSRVTIAELTTPAPRRARVSWTEIELPSPARAEVSWAEHRTPASDLRYRGDIPTRFCGSRELLFTFDSAGFADVSRAANYGAAAGGVPGSWYFCSWGNHVFATNFIDPVQWRQNNTGLFADLITSVDKPRGRFICAARDGVMLGGINSAALAGHEPDEVWWCAFQNAQDFQRAVATQCDSRRLYATPGQLMGLVGGDSPLVFKRRSFFELSWVGGRIVWQPRVVSRSIGTDYPRSIVQGQDEVMWWGGDCFYRYREGGLAEPLGKGIISRFLTDANFSDGAIKRVEPGDMAIEDQIMVGAYDARSGVFLWSYQGANDFDWRHSRAIAYNPAEDRWALFNIPSANVSAIAQLPNTTTSNSAELSGIVGLDFDGLRTTWFQYDSRGAYAASFRTKKFAVQLDESERPLMVRITGIIPVFSVSYTPTGLTPPDITVTLEMATDPGMQEGYDTEAYTSTYSDDERDMLPFDLHGVYARITVDVAAATGRAFAMLDAFEGLYIQWETRGRAAS